MNSTIIQILIIALAIGGPALGKALEAINKKRKEREDKRAAEVAQRESLRTGRPLAQASASTQTRSAPAVPPAAKPPMSAQQRMQELAKKRQQQIEELRRRQQAARQQAQQRQAPRPTTPPQRSQPRPTAQQRPLPQARQQQRPQSRPVARPQPTPSAGMPPPVRPAPRPARVVPRTTISDTPATSIHKLQIDPHVEHSYTEAAVVPVTIMGRTMDATDWRRFVVARELLDPPLAMRRPGQGPLG